MPPKRRRIDSDTGPSQLPAHLRLGTFSLPICSLPLPPPPRPPVYSHPSSSHSMHSPLPPVVSTAPPPTDPPNLHEDLPLFPHSVTHVNSPTSRRAKIMFMSIDGYGDLPVSNTLLHFPSSIFTAESLFESPSVSHVSSSSAAEGSEKGSTALVDNQSQFTAAQQLRQSLSAPPLHLSLRFPPQSALATHPLSHWQYFANPPNAPAQFWSGLLSSSGMSVAPPSTLGLSPLVRSGYGLVDPVSPDLACGSDVAHFSLFGMRPQYVYRGRGALEAQGGGVLLRPGQVSFKSCLGHLEFNSPQWQQYGTPIDPTSKPLNCDPLSHEHHHQSSTREPVLPICSHRKLQESAADALAHCQLLDSLVFTPSGQLFFQKSSTTAPSHAPSCALDFSQDDAFVWDYFNAMCRSNHIVLPDSPLCSSCHNRTIHGFCWCSLSVAVYHAGGHRCLVVLTHNVANLLLSDCCSNTDPCKPNLALQCACPLVPSPAALFTALAMNRVSRAAVCLLNGLWPQRIAVSSQQSQMLAPPFQSALFRPHNSTSLSQQPTNQVLSVPTTSRCLLLRGAGCSTTLSSPFNMLAVSCTHIVAGVSLTCGADVWTMPELRGRTLALKTTAVATLLGLHQTKQKQLTKSSLVSPMTSIEETTIIMTQSATTSSIASAKTIPNHILSKSIVSPLVPLPSMPRPVSSLQHSPLLQQQQQQQLQHAQGTAVPFILPPSASSSLATGPRYTGGQSPSISFEPAGQEISQHVSEQDDRHHDKSMPLSIVTSLDVPHVDPMPAGLLELHLSRTIAASDTRVTPSSASTVNTALNNTHEQRHHNNRVLLPPDDISDAKTTDTYVASPDIHSDILATVPSGVIHKHGNNNPAVHSATSQISVHQFNSSSPVQRSEHPFLHSPPVVAMNTDLSHPMSLSSTLVTTSPSHSTTFQHNFMHPLSNTVPTAATTAATPTIPTTPTPATPPAIISLPVSHHTMLMQSPAVVDCGEFLPHVPMDLSSPPAIALSSTHVSSTETYDISSIPTTTTTTTTTTINSKVASTTLRQDYRDKPHDTSVLDIQSLMDFDQATDLAGYDHSIYDNDDEYNEDNHHQHDNGENDDHNADIRRSETTLTMMDGLNHDQQHHQQQQSHPINEPFDLCNRTQSPQSMHFYSVEQTNTIDNVLGQTQQHTPYQWPISHHQVAFTPDVSFPAGMTNTIIPVTAPSTPLSAISTMLHPSDCTHDVPSSSFRLNAVSAVNHDSDIGLKDNAEPIPAAAPSRQSTTTKSSNSHRNGIITSDELSHRNQRSSSTTNHKPSPNSNQISVVPPMANRYISSATRRNPFAIPSVLFHVKSTDDHAHDGLVLQKGNAMLYVDSALRQICYLHGKQLLHWLRHWVNKWLKQTVRRGMLGINCLLISNPPVAVPTMSQHQPMVSLPRGVIKTMIKPSILHHAHHYLSSHDFFSSYLTHAMYTTSTMQSSIPPLPRLPPIPDPIICCLLGDHTTSCVGAEHSTEPVPLFLRVLSLYDIFNFIKRPNEQDIQYWQQRRQVEQSNVPPSAVVTTTPVGTVTSQQNTIQQNDANNHHSAHSQSSNRLYDPVKSRRSLAEIRRNALAKGSKPTSKNQPAQNSTVQTNNEPAFSTILSESRCARNKTIGRAHGGFVLHYCHAKAALFEQIVQQQTKLLQNWAGIWSIAAELAAASNSINTRQSK